MRHCCKDCQKRHIGCHSSCEDYAELRKVFGAMGADQHRRVMLNDCCIRAQKNFDREHHKGRR